MTDIELNPPRIRRVKVHGAVFGAYVDLYNTATIMARKMDEVLDHYEHKTLIASGLDQGYRMPDVEAVRARNNVIKIYLDGLNPYHDAVLQGDLVEFPARTARQLQLVAHHSTLMIEDVVNNIQKSDYMLWIRNLKLGGGAYMGPTSLQEVFNLWMGLVVASKREQNHLPEKGRRLPANWGNYVV
jgi:hypothetical protein